MKNFFAWVFMIVGLLVAIPSGSCAMIAIPLMSGTSMSGEAGIIGTAVILCLGGVGLFLVGYKMNDKIRSAAKAPPAQSV